MSVEVRDSTLITKYDTTPVIDDYMCRDLVESFPG